MRLENGNVTEVFSMLTGAPSVVLEHYEYAQKPKMLMDILLSHANFPLLLAPVINLKAPKNPNVNPYNSFQLLDTRCLNSLTPSVEGLQLLIFNPNENDVMQEKLKWMPLRRYMSLFSSTIVN